MAWSMRRKTTNRAPRRPGSQWNLRRPQPSPFITETTFCLYSPIAGRVDAGRDGTGLCGTGRVAHLASSVLNGSIRCRASAVGTTSMQSNSYPYLFLSFPFLSQIDLAISLFQISNMGIHYQIWHMWVLFGSILMFSNTYRSCLHNKFRVVLHQQIYNDETYATIGMKLGLPLM